MHRAYLTRNTDRVRLTGTLSPGSVAPVSFISMVDRIHMESFSCGCLGQMASLEQARLSHDLNRIL